MKKTYIIPEISVVWLRTEQVIAASGVTSEEYGIGYGGVDEEGTQDPNVKREHYNVWDDDWRDERDRH